MASRDSLEVRKLLAKGAAVFAGTDKSVALRLRYVGTGTVTSVTAVTATSVETITSDGGTDTFLFSAYATMGALADAINGLGIFEARVLDVLRSAASDDAILAEAITTATYDENNNPVYDLKVDTSGMFYVGACLSNNRAFGLPVDGHRVSLQEIAYVANMGTAASDGLKVYARDIKSGSERLVYAGLSVDTTATTVNFASGNGSITSNDGEELIALIKDGASMADGAYIRVSGILE
ncbi:MAG: hypothetical protein WC069_05985 [Candidatus Shapirobacteria bacterium]